MVASFVVTKAELHDLVDALPDESLDAAAMLLRRAQDPTLARLEAAEFDDEPLTAEDREVLDRAREDPGVAWDEAKAELAD